MKKAQQGNDKAFLKLLQQYEADIYRTAFLYVKNENDASDVVQEVAYRSFKNIHTLKNPEYFKTWLIKITITCAINVLQKSKKVVPLRPESEEFIGSHDEDISLSLTIQNLLNTLDEDEKSVVLLKFYNDYTFKEIAQTLEIPLGTAKSILYRALNKLREQTKEDEIYG
ncbi:sigma-70 family RNA polymerase sigma factor [Sporosarcina beigongshangi]|uniref:sigma-70 family RNA polymerase sigma factor n=1 Tax=Sporosarcina beigongshangi TaxID=2782538 RepID=UPI001939EAC3|nr:sigma-70 family RNA polymerase sigma factor [Sporosarcina beigongshangi]